MLIFGSKNRLKTIKSNCTYEKNRTSDSLEDLLVQPNAEDFFLDKQNVTVNFHEVETH